MQEILVEAKNLKKHFQSNSFFSRRDKAVRAVDGISFCIPRGETFGLVGESGCGKSTTGRLLLRLLEPTAGQAFFRGRSIFELEKKELQKLRREMQVIFQDSFSSLNMRMNVGDIISEPLEIHGIGGKGERKDKVSELMHLVGLSPEHAGRFPHEFSGGQRQRVGIARALAVNPLFIVADEPVSSLDVSMRAQILNLMKDLQERLGLTYLFIAHDLSTVRFLCDSVTVMYLGKIVEMGPNECIFQDPRHPYTQTLLAAATIPDPEIKRNRIILSGEMPSPTNPPPGCRFHTRCPRVADKCKTIEPVLRDVGNGQMVSCHIA
ncbi:MAG: Oligopeptide transport ATP-binding protein OppF [Syntrophomonadaceae bacterium]|nr:Oligopeptide transport ATP-binding protein OppF [Bacillota bacterium]MBT9146723.1 Oligopeptide transport ATP-binding protein OppF [Bacillota bacterium]